MITFFVKEDILSCPSNLKGLFESYDLTVRLRFGVA